MTDNWKKSVYLQSERLARILHQPLALLAERCVPVWGDRDGMNAVLADGLGGIPHCTFLYCPVPRSTLFCVLSEARSGQLLGA